MHGMTKDEVAVFKKMRAAAREMRTIDDAKAVKAMAADWVRAAPNPTARMRRRNMARCIRGSHAEF